MSDGRPKSEKELAAELRLRPERPSVTRLSRKVLMGLVGVSGLVVVAALIWALQPREPGDDGTELYTTENKPLPDGLTTLPRDYTGLPREVPELGPPLPGDLGRPILRARERGQPVPAVDPAVELALQEAEAARTSDLFFSTSSAADEATVPEVIDYDPSALAAVQAQAGDRQVDFLNGPADTKTVSGERLQAAASPYVVQAGSVIPAALFTGIRSDLPGQVTAQVTSPVYDTPTGRFLLIPQGSRLIGIYDAQVAFGQSRVLLVWTRLILPDGRSIVLERAPAADTAGFAGLQDRVDYHWRRLFLAAGLSTLLGVGAELGSGDENEIARAIRESGQDTANETGQEIVRRQLNVEPTLTIRPGFPVRVMVHRDLVLAPYY